MNRIEMIRKYRETTEAEEVMKKAAAEAKTVRLVKEILALHDRVEELIETANACLENGITISGPKGPWYWNEDTRAAGQFCTNGITHRLGFVRPKLYNPVEYLGIDGGGACGEHYLRVKGGEVFCTRGEPSTFQMEKFLKDFDEFESAFYAYVDRICATKN